MKRVIIVILCGFLTFSTTVANNVKFMGISMEAPFSEFVSELSNKCEIVGVNSSVAIFNGDFAGLKDCSIMVGTTDGLLIVMVVSQEYKSWQQLKSDYLAITDAYEKKYGTPKQKELSFKGSYYDGDGYEMTAVKNDKCNYTMSYLIDETLLVTIFIGKDSTINFAYAIIKKEKEPTKIEVNTDDI